MKSLSCLMLIALMAACIPAVSAAPVSTTSTDQGWYVIHCNVYNSDVYFDEKYLGAILQGTLSVAAPTSGTPPKQFSVKKYGYSTFVGTIPGSPGQGQSIDLYATLNPVPTGMQTGVGGDMGWYLLHSNINGASVFFDGVDKGTITEGVVYVPIFSTGTPYHTYSVKKDGYTTYVGTITSIPKKGETVDLYATLNPSGTPSSLGGDIGYYVVHSNVDGAVVTFDNVTEGKIYQGMLTVQVYVTGTPFTTYSVVKPGYATFSGPITNYPGKGAIVDLYTNLTPLATPTPTQAPLPVGITSSALVFAMVGAIVLGKKKKKY